MRKSTHFFSCPVICFYANIVPFCALPAPPGNPSAKIFGLVTRWQRNLYLPFQAFYPVACHASKMKVVMTMPVAAPAAQGVVILSVIGHYPVHYTVFAKAVEHTVYGNAVHRSLKRPLYFVLA
jgi:hypothetical protein